MIAQYEEKLPIYDYIERYYVLKFFINEFVRHS